MALMPVEEALARVLDEAEPLPPEAVAVAEAHGRVLAADLAARRTQPTADVSAMDGYAVRAADVATVPARLKLIGEVAAGRAFDGRVGAGETVRIFTGGVVPHGADTIVIQEVTRRDGEAVVVESRERGWAPYPPRRTGFQRGRPAAAPGPVPHRARFGAGGRHESSDRAGASPAARRRDFDRR